MKTTSKNNRKIATVVFSIAMLLAVNAFPANAKMQELTKTSVPLDIPLVMGYADGNEVFYITTETSEKAVSEHLSDLLSFSVTYTPTLKNTPKTALANIYEFTNGVEGSGPAGFQPNVADSQPGDAKYSPLWSVQHVTWVDQSNSRELTSEDEILAARDAGELSIEATGVVVNCPFVQWNGGNLPVRENKELTDKSPYGGGQVLKIDTDKMVVTFVAHRGFGPDGSTIYYIATDASSQDAANALGIQFVNKTQSALVSSAASDLYVFTNGITGTGPMGFQASIGSTNAGDEYYSPLWRIQTATWANPETASFLTTTAEISDAATNGELATAVGGFIVNCPFIEISMKSMDDSMMEKDGMKDSEHMTPVQQMKDGVESRQVQCNDGLQLLLKASGESAICVKSDTASVLIQRGWAIQP